MTRATLWGVLSGAALAIVVGAPLAVVFSRHAVQARTTGWKPTALVVASVDVPAGTEATIDTLAQRSLPTMFVSPAAARPAQASWLMNQLVTVPLEAGEPISWWALEGPWPSRACRLHLETLLSHREPNASLDRLAAELRRQASEHSVDNFDKGL